MDIRELGEEQLECTEENDELLQGHCAVFSSVVVLVHSLEAAAGCDLDCNVVAHRCHLLEERHIPVSPGTFNNTTVLYFSVATPSCQQQFLLTENEFTNEESNNNNQEELFCERSLVSS